MSARFFVLPVLFVGALIGAAAQQARAQDIPPRELLDLLFSKSQASQPVAPLQIAIEPVQGKTIQGQCKLQYGQLRQTRGDKLKTFEMLVDRFGNGADGPTQALVNVDRLTVDADGSARAYHPEDPLGVGVCSLAQGKDDPWVGVCAVDRLSSASIHIYRGVTRIPAVIGKDPNPEYASAWSGLWPSIRDKQLQPIDLAPFLETVPRNIALYYSAAKNTAIVFRNTEIIPFKDNSPCLRAVEPKGYFVAGTAKRIRQTDDVCDATQYLDAMAIPYFVIPGNVFRNVKVGDLAIGHAKVGAEDRLVFGVVGDTGNVGQIGEASIAFNAKLLNREGAPMNVSAANALDIYLDPDLRKRRRELANFKSMSVLLLGNTQSQLQGDFSRQNIEKIGKQALAQWSGAGNSLKALNDCIASAPPNPHEGTLSTQ